jgi:acetylornithine deacetylase/succinyl-diaminopimelate desuccinylase-like protein
MTSTSTVTPPPAEAIERMGGKEAYELLRQLIALDTTNLEDPAGGREEKRHYVEAAEFLSKTARGYGMTARIWDARTELPNGGTRFRSPRPSVIADLDRGRPTTVLVMAHLDVVPVPDEQLSRWGSPPHELTWRSSGRFFGRGCNDDLGSGVLCSLIALKRLSQQKDLPVNVRLLICPDEETGGAGGIEAIAEHDHALPADSRERILRADLALIPDGAPYVAAGCSGVAFVDFSLEGGAAPLAQHLALAEGVVGFDPTARSWVSRLPSPDFPDRGAPDPHITGRATLTKMDLTLPPGHAPRAEVPRLDRAHAESDAANQIPEAVTLSFEGDPARLDTLLVFLEKHVTDPYHLVVLKDEGSGGAGSKPAPRSDRRLRLRVVGRAGHGGYPHRAANPVPVSVSLLQAAGQAGVLDPTLPEVGAFTLDLRSPPEMPSDDVLALFDNRFRLLRSELPGATYKAPDSRRRSGYALDPGHPAVVAVRRAFERVKGGEVGVFGEYGGTDASSLRDVRTPKGEPLPAIVVGAMDPEARIHDADENVDPALLGLVQNLLVEVLRTYPNAPK